MRTIGILCIILGLLIFTAVIFAQQQSLTRQAPPPIDPGSALVVTQAPVTPQGGTDDDLYGNTRLWWWTQTEALPGGVGVYTYSVVYIAAPHMAPLLEPGQVPWFGDFDIHGLP